MFKLRPESKPDKLRPVRTLLADQSFRSSDAATILFKAPSRSVGPGSVPLAIAELSRELTFKRASRLFNRDGTVVEAIRVEVALLTPLRSTGVRAGDELELAGIFEGERFKLETKSTMVPIFPRRSEMTSVVTLVTRGS